MDKILLAKQEKWYRSDLGYLLHAGQKIIDNTFKGVRGQLFVANISRQWGKSFWAVSKCVQLALSKPKTRIKYGTAFQTDLVEFILPTFDAVLQDCPESLKPKYKVQGSKWIFANGSEIKLIGLDKSPNSLRGNVIDMIVIDEAGFVDNLSYIYSSIIVPATLHRPNCKIVFISTPPATPAHPFGDFIQMADSQNSYVKLDIYTNPRITKDDIERMAAAMGGEDSTTFRRECLCELVLDDDLALIKDWKDDYIQDLEKDQYFHHYHKYVGMDLGRKDHTALIFGYYDFKKAALIIEDELTMYGPSWTTITLKDAILAKEKELWGESKPFRRVSDNNNPHLIQDLNSLHDVHFMETTKESLEAMINEVRIMVGNGQIIVHPKCKMLIGCLRYGIWDKNRKQFARNKVYGHYDHLAALIYLVRNLAKHTNPIPATFNQTYRTWTMNLSKNKSPNANVMANALLPKKHKSH